MKKNKMKTVSFSNKIKNNENTGKSRKQSGNQLDDSSRRRE